MFAGRVLSSGPFAFFIMACSPAPGEPLPPTPVFQLTLVAGDSSHTGTITWTAQPDSTVPLPLRPVDPALVALVVSGPNGSAPVVAGDSAGQFKVNLVAIPGGEYSVQGTVGDQIIRGSTAVPRRFELDLPNPDTISRATLALDPTSSILFPVFRIPAKTEGVESIVTPGGGLDQERHEIVFSVFRANAIGPFTLRAANHELTEWFTGRFFRVNSQLTSGIGVLGGAIDVHFVLVP